MTKHKNQLKIGVILNYFNLLVGNIIPILYTPIMLELLGQNEYGLFKLSSSVTSYLSLMSLGIGSAVTRYLIKANTEEGKDAEERVLGLFMRIFQAIAVAVFVVGCLLAVNLGLFYSASLSPVELDRMKILTFIMVCNTALSFSLSPYVAVTTTHERFVFTQIMNIVSTCVGPILNLVALFLGYASIGMAVSTLALGVISRFVYFCYVRRRLNIRPQYKNLPTELLREALTFSFWVFVANVVSQLYNATDTVLIGAIPTLGTVGVAIYNVGGTFNNMVFSLTTGISTLLSPRTNKMVFSGASNAELTDLAIRIGRLQGHIISLVVTGFIAFGQPFIHMYAGADYEEAYWVAILMMVPNMIPLVQSVCLSIIVAKNQHKFRSLVYLGIAVLNVVGTWFMMQWWGIVGAALMTGLAVILGQGFAMNWFYKKKSGIEIGRFWKRVSGVYVIPSILCAIALLSSRWIDYYNTLYMLIGILAYTVVYAVLSWFLSFNDYEKGLLRAPLSKIFRKKERN